LADPAAAADPPRRTELPPRPPEPDPRECCGRGCVNCIFVYYEQALERWRLQVAAIEAGTGGVTEK
jgi:hypothetical protein